MSYAATVDSELPIDREAVVAGSRMTQLNCSSPCDSYTICGVNSRRPVIKRHAVIIIIGKCNFVSCHRIKTVHRVTLS